MRRYLNLNQLSLLFVQVIGILMVVVPAVLYGIVLVWGENEIIRTFVMRILKVSIVAGAFVLVVFLVLIVVEQVQDHYIDARYQKTAQSKDLTGKWVL